MIAKIDAAEAYAWLNSVALIVTAAVIVLLFLAVWWIFDHSLHAAARSNHYLERDLLVKRLDFLSRFANDAIVLSDMNGAIIEVNERSLVTYGYTRDEMIGMRVSNLRAPHLREELWPQRDRLLAHECLVHETENLHKKGHVFPVEVSNRMIEIDGKCYFQAIVRDITERKNAVERIQKLSRLKAAIAETNRAILHSHSPAEMYRAVCHACVAHGNFSLVWVGLADPDAQRINPVEVAGSAFRYVEDILISTRADVPQGQGPSAIACREQRIYVCNDFSTDPAVAPWRDRAAAYGLASSISLPMARGGMPYGALTAYGPEKNSFDDESVDLLSVMAQSISFAIDQFDLDAERQRGEHELRQSEEKFRTLVENLPQGVFVKDSDSIYVSGNTAFARDIGIDPDKITGRTDHDFFPPELAEKYRNDDRRVMKLGKVEEIQEEYRAQGKQKFAHTIKAPVRNEQGQIVGVLGVFWDITERRKLEHEQSIQAKRLEELSRRLVAVQEEERQRLAGELHDRASPNLAAIKITLGTLAGALPQQVLADAESSLEDARALLDDTTASIREICAELRPTVLDYAGLIPALNGYAAQFMKRTAMKVRVRELQDGVRLGKDIESALFRIVQEALTNCAKHACAKNVDIELANSGRHVALTIKDDGFGFDPDARARSGNMSGLGLITMKERAEFVGGTFIVTSHPLTGTEIRVELENKGDCGSNLAPSVGFESQSACELPGPERPTLN